jgi:hypothetical protein
VVPVQERERRTPPPNGKAQQPSKAGMAKAAAQKKQKPQNSAQPKHDERKNDTATDKERERAKNAEKKAHTTVAAGGGPDLESISPLHAAHQKFPEIDHDYDGHRRRSMQHVGAALGHVGSSAQAGYRSGKPG